KPKPIKGFNKNRTILIPYEPFEGIIYNLFKDKILKSSNLYNSIIFLLKDKTIIFKSIGAPQSVMCLERLIASGTNEIILLGFCGSLEKAIKIGSIVIAGEAYSQEGTSSHYYKNKKLFNASRKLLIEIKKVLEKYSFPYKIVRVASTDAPFRETSKWLKRMADKGISCVDMETSAVYALAQYYKIDAVSLMIVTDMLGEKTWISGISDIKKEIKKYFSLFI
ncbi:nucleoside phosphorylase, partial [Candidatus Aminicenantes bacterium AC-335-G13]|nr:nucleoside phosphorylase [Candidatus Aminicenantes bacterium AC-335-G13]